MCEVDVSKKTLGQSFILVLQTAKHNKTWNYPEYTGVTIIYELTKDGVFFFGGLHNRTECDYLGLFLLLEEVSFSFLPIALVFLECKHEFRVVFELWVYHFEVLPEKTKYLSNILIALSYFLGKYSHRPRLKLCNRAQDILSC